MTFNENCFCVRHNNRPIHKQYFKLLFSKINLNLRTLNWISICMKLNLLFIRNLKKTHTNKSMRRFLYSFWIEATHKPCLNWSATWKETCFNEYFLLFVILVGQIDEQKLLNPKLICIKLEFGLKCSYISIFYSDKTPLPKPLRDFCNFKSKRGTKRSKLR